jgi:hypothetical protein
MLWILLYETGYVYRANLLPLRQNSNSESRNNIKSPKLKTKRASLQGVHFRDLEIWILNLFRISKFELRISEDELDHFVNFVETKKT